MSMLSLCRQPLGGRRPWRYRRFCAGGSVRRRFGGSALLRCMLGAALALECAYGFLIFGMPDAECLTGLLPEKWISISCDEEVWYLEWPGEDAEHEEVSGIRFLPKTWEIQYYHRDETVKESVANP
ncbi:MAG: hypothetical protein LUC99_08380 [Clostridiales bacterium]|nr:hypothetical protein [Clostridiales bacterium]